jgi:hypothetical protein
MPDSAACAAVVAAPAGVTRYQARVPVGVFGPPRAEQDVHLLPIKRSVGRKGIAH